MSTIIKRSGSNAPAGAVPFRFDELPGTVTPVRDAADVIAQAHSEADAIRRGAEEQGRAAAVEAAERILEEKVSHRVASMISALGAAVDRIADAKAQWLGHWERQAVHLAAAIAARVVRREVERTPEITLTLVRDALELAAGASDIQLRMHPDDYQALGPDVERIATQLTQLGHARIVADPQVTKGGCRVDTRHGTIDQQFEAQLARIEQELT